MPMAKLLLNATFKRRRPAKLFIIGRKGYLGHRLCDDAGQFIGARAGSRLVSKKRAVVDPADDCYVRR